jgi:hypothetical protein
MIINSLELLIKIIDAYKQARQYKDKYLYEDRMKWLRDRFDEDHFDFPDDYDFSSTVESIGIMMAQTEKYGGIVLETNKGILPYTELSHSGLTRLSKNKGK